MKNLWRAWAQNAVLSHSNSVKFYRSYHLNLDEMAGVVSRDMYRLSMESCAFYQIIGLRSIYIYICLCEHILCLT